MQRRMRIGEGQTQTGVATARAMGYGFDANGHPVSLVYPGGLTLTFTVDALGQASAIASPGQTWASGIAHDPDGVITGFTYGNGIVHSLTRNARKLPLRSRDLDGATAVHDDSYTYDAVGNVTAIDDGVTGHRGDRTMTYDDLNRLTGATSPMFDTASYGYDVQDNLVRVTVTGGAARDRDYCYDAANRLTNIKTGGCAGTTVVGLGYDLQGNLANRNGTLYGFDYGNRLRGVGTERYRYDAWGRRTQTASAIDSDTIDSLYGQDGALYFQVDERAGKVLWYVYLGGSLIATRSESLGGGTAQIAWQHTDALGSPVATTNSSKTVLQRSEYEPYGYLVNRPLEDGPGYTGHVTDAATGMIYMQQRYYDPVLGRFDSVDAITAYDKGDMRFFVRYAYAFNNPYTFADLDGRQSIQYGPKAIPLSPFSEKVLLENMRRAGVSSMTVTSTYRAPADQARVMYQNVEKYGVKSQMKLYGSAGQQVIQAYSEAQEQGLGRTDTITKMTDVIVEQMKENPDLYKHSQDPAKINTADISPSSVDGNRSSLISEFQSDSRISNVLTPPKDPAIHVEIPQERQN